MRLAILHERNAFHIFHDEEGSSVWSRVRVIQTCNRWMVQPRERALFNGEPLSARWREPGVTENLDCNFSVKIRALGEIHHAHAAVPENLFQSIGAELIERKVAVVIVLKDFVGYVSDIMVKKRSAGSIFLEQSEHLTDEGFVIAAKGERLGARLKALAVKPTRVREARGRGLMWGVELSEAAAPVVAAARERQLLIASAGPNVLRLVPPLIVSESEIDRAVDVLAEILA